MGRTDVDDSTSGRILVVDDEPLILEVMQKVLHRGGHRTVSASDGQVALDILADPSQHVDLVVFDLRMPHVDGHDMFEQLLQHRPGLPTILMTATELDGEVAELQRRGVDEVLQKPFRAQALVDAVARCLGVN